MPNFDSAPPVAMEAEEATAEREATAAAASASKGTPKCKKKKNKEAKAKEMGMVEQEPTTPVVPVSEETPKCKKKMKKKKHQEQHESFPGSDSGVVVKEAEGKGMEEREATSAAASALEGTPKRKKKKKNEAKAKERGVAEQEATTGAVSALEGTPKQKKKKKEEEEAKAKERGVMEQEATAGAVSSLEGTPKWKKKKKKKKDEEAKAKERGIAEQESTTGAVSASEETPKCKKRKEAKVQECEMTEQEATTTAISASEGTPKLKEEEATVKNRGMIEQDAATAAVSASEGTPKYKKMKKKKKMQEQLESPQALSAVIAADKIVVNKYGNGCADGEGPSRDADVSMDPVNREDPSCAQSKAKDADDLVESIDGRNVIKNCTENSSSLQESSVGGKKQKKKRKQRSSSRGPSQNGDRVAKNSLDSSTDHGLSCTCALCLVQAPKEKARNIYSLRGSLIRFQRKKLLILDLNGLLADINQDYHNAHMAHAKVRAKLVFRRPYCDDFLRFCFQNFELGIWSSRKKENVNSVVNILMRDLKQYLLFCWDMSKCTVTGCNTVDNKHKPLVLKELNKLWNKEEPNLPWEQGDFSPSNTLLVDDSPYKALCNPPHTAIFPHPYSYLNQRDDYSLGPGGDLRMYLERLAAADDVQVFVRDSPFGQPSITESDPHWNFYVQIVDKVEKSSA